MEPLNFDAEMEVIKKRTEKLRSLMDTEPVRDLCLAAIKEEKISQAEIGLFFVMSPDKQAGEVMTWKQMAEIDLEVMAGWTRISPEDFLLHKGLTATDNVDG